MPHTDETFYKMKCGWAEDPKVSALARFGAVDACLSRDLFGQLIDYARRELTDGLVPVNEIGRLAYPLPADHAMLLAMHLASPGPYGALCEWIGADAESNAASTADSSAPGNALRILAYGRWNDTRAEVQARKVQGSKAARARWNGADAPRTAGSNAGAIDRARAQVDAEQEQEQEQEDPPRRRSSTGASGNGAATEDDDSINRIFAMLHAHGPLSREQAIAYRDSLVAGRRIEDPGRYAIAAIRKDPKAAYREAIAATPASPTRLPPPPSMICRRCGAIGEHREADCPKPPPSDDAAKHGAAAARAGLVNRPRGAQAAALGEDSTDPTGAGLHGEELARAQLAASRLGGTIIGVEPGAATTTAEPEEGDEEYVPPF